MVKVKTLDGACPLNWLIKPLRAMVTTLCEEEVDERAENSATCVCTELRYSIVELRVGLNTADDDLGVLGEANEVAEETLGGHESMPLHFGRVLVSAEVPGTTVEGLLVVVSSDEVPPDLPAAEEKWGTLDVAF
jgi:hypothetical protein